MSYHVTESDGEGGGEGREGEGIKNIYILSVTRVRRVRMM